MPVKKLNSPGKIASSKKVPKPNKLKIKKILQQQNNIQLLVNLYNKNKK